MYNVRVVTLTVSVSKSVNSQKEMANGTETVLLIRDLLFQRTNAFLSHLLKFRLEDFWYWHPVRTLLHTQFHPDLELLEDCASVTCRALVRIGAKPEVLSWFIVTVASACLPGISKWWITILTILILTVLNYSKYSSIVIVTIWHSCWLWLCLWLCRSDWLIVTTRIQHSTCPAMQCRNTQHQPQPNFCKNARDQDTVKGLSPAGICIIWFITNWSDTQSL